MIYIKFKDLQLSTLGMGAMRLPTLSKKNQQIDEDATAKMIDYAYHQGINYFDTAWGYHDGYSEIVLGKILSQYPRDSFYLADKFPGYDLNNMNKVEEIFERQLEKCQVDYFDFYLFHNVCEMNIDAYLDEQKYGILKYLIKQKQLGRIKHLGFSTHGSNEVIERFLEAYGKDMEFCQIQLNYLDWTFQDAKQKVEILDKYNIPIWVMEPLRGGKLVTLNEQQTSLLSQLRPYETSVSWAFRFLQSIDNVKMVLSGMSNDEQLQENIKIFSDDLPLMQKEMKTLLTIADEMIKEISLPCTACQYCISHCPKQLDIPNLLQLYNEHIFTGGGFIAPMALSAIEKEKQPSACIECHACEKVCPQQIKISKAMHDFVEKMK